MILSNLSSGQGKTVIKPVSAAVATWVIIGVEKLMIKEGDTVKSGQIVAILDNYKVRQAELAQAEDQVKVATARLARIKLKH